MKGYSLLECLVGLSLVGILSLMTVQFVRQSNATLGHHHHSLEQRIAMTKSALIVSAAITSLERGRVPGLITITNGDRLITSHGDPHPTVGLSAASAPRPDSTVLSALGLDPRYRGRVKRTTFSGNSISLEVCNLLNVPSRDQFRSFLAVGVQGTCQLVGEPHSLGAGCLSITGTPIRGLLTTLPCEPATLLELFPIAREFSIFVDRTGELRLASHVGMRITENQPIVRGLRTLTIIEKTSESGASLYKVALTATTSRPLHFSVAGGLTRVPLWNEILL